MSDSTVILADLDDIVFENRDKEYGAYDLRKKYRTYLLIAALIAFIAVALGTGGPLLVKLLFSGKGDDEMNIDRNVVVTAINLDIPPPPEEEPPPPLEVPPPKISAIEFKVPIPKPDEEVQDETIHEMEEIEEEENISTEDVEGDDKGYDFGEIEGTGKVQAVVEEPKDPSPDEFIMVEKEPQPVNMDDIKRLIGYPQPAKEAEIEGKVVVRVLVGADGKYVKHVVIKNPHNILTKAVEDQLKHLSFTPGIQAGKPIKVWVSIPFDFKLMK